MSRYATMEDFDYAMQRIEDDFNRLIDDADRRWKECETFYCESCGARQRGEHRCTHCHARIEP